ncbi:MAG: hypothetical protein ACRD72_26250, partial [Candidatus Angelobacter sp.]
MQLKVVRGRRAKVVAAHNKERKESMKRTKLLQSLAIAAFALLGLAGTAKADYTGNCANIPDTVSGNIIITDTVDCSLKDITATGYVTITAPGFFGPSTMTLHAGGNITLTSTSTTSGNISVGLDAGGNVNVHSGFNIWLPFITSGGNVVLKADNSYVRIDGTISAPGHIVVVSASGDVSLQNIDASTTSGYGSVRIFSNKSGGSDAFV